jgi:hypothetical protein
MAMVESGTGSDESDSGEDEFMDPRPVAVRRGRGSTVPMWLEELADRRLKAAKAVYARRKTQFVDAEFPPTDASLGPSKRELKGESQFARYGKSNKGKVIWLAPKSLRDDEATSGMESAPASRGRGAGSRSGRKHSHKSSAWGSRYGVCRDGFRAGDCAQRALGDCWLISAAAVAAESSKALDNVFRSQKRQTSGMYQLRICVGGVWTVVDVDCSLPAVESKRVLAFSSAVGRQLWPSLMEKAIAKLSGTYEAIEGGRIGEALELLTGCPHTTVGVSRRGAGTLIVPDTRSDSARVVRPTGRPTQYAEVAGKQGWRLLKRWLAAGRLLGASVGTGPMGDGGEEEATRMGLVTTHAYSLLGLLEVGGVNLVELRNPWLRGEWNGAYSDSWEGWTDALREEAGSALCATDGVFLMRWEDFCTFFNSIDVAMEVDDIQGDGDDDGDSGDASCLVERCTVALPVTSDSSTWPAMRLELVGAPAPGDGTTEAPGTLRLPETSTLTLSTHQPTDRVRRWFERHAPFNADPPMRDAAELRTSLSDVGVALVRVPVAMLITEEERGVEEGADSGDCSGAGAVARTVSATPAAEKHRLAAAGAYHAVQEVCGLHRQRRACMVMHSEGLLGGVSPADPSAEELLNGHSHGECAVLAVPLGFAHLTRRVDDGEEEEESDDDDACKRGPKRHSGVSKSLRNRRGRKPTPMDAPPSPSSASSSGPAMEVWDQFVTVRAAVESVDRPLCRMRSSRVRLPAPVVSALLLRRCLATGTAKRIGAGVSQLVMRDSCGIVAGVINSSTGDVCVEWRPAGGSRVFEHLALGAQPGAETYRRVVPAASAAVVYIVTADTPSWATDAAAIPDVGFRIVPAPSEQDPAPEASSGILGPIAWKDPAPVGDGSTGWSLLLVLGAAALALVLAMNAMVAFG